MLAARMALAPDDAESAGVAIQQLLIATAEFSAARVIALYAPFRKEVDTWEVLKAALTTGKIVLFPSVTGEDLVFRVVAGESDLQSGRYGIMEPGAGCTIVDPGQAQLLIVPGVVFDKNGIRIGYGKGFYDRALHMLEGSGRIWGFCYGFQLVESIAGEPHDVVMDAVVTEFGVLRCNRRRIFSAGGE